MFVPPKPGERRGGRQKGSRNKITEQLRNAVMFAYRGLGGQKGMLEWAREHPDLFYTRIMPMLMPKAVELTGADGERLEPIRVVRVIAPQAVVIAPPPASPVPLNGHNGHS